MARAVYLDTQRRRHGAREEMSLGKEQLPRTSLQRSDWNLLKDFKPPSPTHTSELGLGGIYFTKDLEEEQFLTLF